MNSNLYTAVYTPPETLEGTVTLSMPESVAQKLHALLSCCNGLVFDDLTDALDTLPLSRLSMIAEGVDPPANVWPNGRLCRLNINLHSGLKFMPFVG
jgi:hypothetical protein